MLSAPPPPFSHREVSRFPSYLPRIALLYTPLVLLLFSRYWMPNMSENPLPPKRFLVLTLPSYNAPFGATCNYLVNIIFQASLNARTSILAAANPIGGRYDRTKSLKVRERHSLVSMIDYGVDLSMLFVASTELLCLNMNILFWLAIIIIFGLVQQYSIKEFSTIILINNIMRLPFKDIDLWNWLILICSTIWTCLHPLCQDLTCSSYLLMTAMR